MRVRRRAARRPFHRAAHPDRPGGHDAGRWGSHGDYDIIALCPNSPQECFDLAVGAFNLTETWRVPVFIMTDEMVGPHARKGGHPPRRRRSRWWSASGPGSAQANTGAYGTTAEDLVPEMVKAGDGYRFHITGLTHDERGYPSLTPATQDKMVTRLVEQDPTATPTRSSDVARTGWKAPTWWWSRFGITSRMAMRAIDTGPGQGLKVGSAPPDHRLALPGRERSARWPARVKAIVVPEMNMGQIVLEVERAVAGARQGHQPCNHAGGDRARSRRQSWTRSWRPRDEPGPGHPLELGLTENPCRRSCAWTACRTSGAPAAASAPRSTASAGPWAIPGWTWTRWPSSRASAAPAAPPATSTWTASTPPTAGPSPSPPASSWPIPSSRWWSTPATATCRPSAATT